MIKRRDEDEKIKVGGRERGNGEIAKKRNSETSGTHGFKVKKKRRNAWLMCKVTDLGPL